MIQRHLWVGRLLWRLLLQGEGKEPERVLPPPPPPLQEPPAAGRAGGRKERRLQTCTPGFTWQPLEVCKAAGGSKEKTK